MLKEMSGGQKDIIEFEQQNQYWVFTLSGSPVMGGGVNVGIKVKVLAL